MKKSKIISIILVACMTISLSACSSSGSKQENTTTPAATTDTNSVVKETEPAKVDTTTTDLPKTGGVIKIATLMNPTVIGYPAMVTNNGPLPFLDPVVEALLKFDSTGAHVPWLADSWDLDAEAKTITFHLKKDVKFSDGTDFNADSVLWNIGQYQENKRNEVGNIDTMEASDENTVVIHLKEWTSSSLESIGFFIRYISPTAFETNNNDIDHASANPVGTGAFILTDWQKNVKAVYAKNPLYREPGKPYLDGIEMYIVSDNTAAGAAIQSGQYDVLMPGDNTVTKQLSDSGNFNVVSCTTGLGAVGVGLIPDETYPDSPWASADVRKALCYAIDNEAIVKAFGNGYSQAINQWAVNGSITYNPDVVAQPYDPAKAKELLTQAEYPDGFKTKIFANASTKDIFTAIQAMLQEVGIDAELIVDDEAATAKKYATDQSWEGGLMGHFFSIQPDLGLYMWRHLNPEGAFYAGGILHPQDALDLIKKVQTAPDAATKQQYSFELQKLVYDEYALFGKPLFVGNSSVVKQKYVTDDGFMITHASLWTPSETWLNK